MAASFSTHGSNDKAGLRRECITFTVDNPGDLATGTPKEGIVALPRSGVDGASAGNGWELIDVLLAVGTNVTHADGSITATVEKNTDGGTTALATNPSILNDAGTGRKTTRTAGTGITPAVIHATEANRRFADDDVAFVTITPAGSAGADGIDVTLQLTFARIQDFNPTA